MILKIWWFHRTMQALLVFFGKFMFSLWFHFYIVLFVQERSWGYNCRSWTFEDIINTDMDAHSFDLANPRSTGRKTSSHIIYSALDLSPHIVCASNQRDCCLQKQELTHAHRANPLLQPQTLEEFNTWNFFRWRVPFLATRCRQVLTDELSLPAEFT